MKWKQADEIPESIDCALVIRWGGVSCKHPCANCLNSPWEHAPEECGGKASLLHEGERPTDFTGLEIFTFVCDKCGGKMKRCFAQQG